jgi:hypothetical protein
MKTDKNHGTCLPPEAYIRLAQLAQTKTPKIKHTIYPNKIKK